MEKLEQFVVRKPSRKSITRIIRKNIVDIENNKEPENASATPARPVLVQNILCLLFVVSCGFSGSRTVAVFQMDGSPGQAVNAGTSRNS